MNKVKIRLITLVALIVALAVAVGLAIGSLFPFQSVSAATTYSPSSVFSAGVGSNVTAYKGSEENAKAYVGFSMNDGGNVYFYRDLAFKWFEKDESASESTRANPGKAVYFSLKFSFPKINFETFTVTFESGEENVSKDGKATNSITFTKDTNNGVKIKVAGSDKEHTYAPAEGKTLTGDFTLSFTGEGDTAGDFVLSLTYDGGAATPTQVFNGVETFKNIGDNFAEYRSSASSKPNTPIAFSVKMPEGEKTAQKVLVKELNGQSFEVKDGTAAATAEADGTFEVTGGKVEDNKAPALVLSETLYAFRLGQKFSLSYETIDVLDDTVSITRRYYVAKKSTEAGKENEYVKPDESKTSDYKTLTTSTYFMPSDDADENEEVYLSIRFELDDGRGAKQSEYVYLSWYAAEDAVKTLDGWDYVLANRETEGPRYTVLKLLKPVNEPGRTIKNLTEGDKYNYNTVVKGYQKRLDEAAEKTSAGEGSYIYLPSLRDLITSDTADYRNLKFSIYYYTQNQTESSTALSETSLKYNALKLEVDVEGQYKFRVLATDSAGNGIKLYHKGELVEVTSTNIWEIENYPEFTFNVKYDGASIDNLEEQSLGYRETSYTLSKFDIVALSGYVADYTLYYLDESRLADGKEMPSYSDLVSSVTDYMEGEDYKAYQDCLDTIEVYNDEYTEDDEEWDDTDNAYRWDPDDELSFCPQKSGFYIVSVSVTDPNRSNEVTKAYQVIEVRNPLDVTPGKSLWLENNKLSVILFSISGVLVIAIVVISLVRPSDQKVEDVDLEKLKGKKNRKE